MGHIEAIYAAAANAGLLKRAHWHPADGSAPVEAHVGFTAQDTTMLDGLALGTDLEMTFPATVFTGIAVRDAVEIGGVVYQVRDLRALGDGSERRVKLARF